MQAQGSTKVHAETGREMQKINILGMSLTDYSFKEAIGITDRFLGNGSLNTILFVSAKILVGAGSAAKKQAWIEAADLIVWSDAEIVRQAGVMAKNRIHEVENQEYFKEILRRFGRGGNPLYLLADSEDELEKLGLDLNSFREALNIAGAGIVGGMQAEWENEANRINELAPVAIISRMQFEKQAEIVESMKQFLNAEIWLALDNEMIPDSRRVPLLRKLLSKWDHHVFQKLLSESRRMNRQDEKSDRTSE